MGDIRISLRDHLLSAVGAGFTSLTSSWALAAGGNGFAGAAAAIAVGGAVAGGALAAGSATGAKFKPLSSFCGLIGGMAASVTLAGSLAANDPSSTAKAPLQSHTIVLKGDTCPKQVLVGDPS